MGLELVIQADPSRANGEQKLNIWNMEKLKVGVFPKTGALGDGMLHGSKV